LRNLLSNECQSVGRKGTRGNRDSPAEGVSPRARARACARWRRGEGFEPSVPHRMETVNRLRRARSSRSKRSMRSSRWSEALQLRLARSSAWPERHGVPSRTKFDRGRPRGPAGRHSMPSSSRASSLIRSGPQGGVQTSLTRTSLTPGTARIAASTSPGMLAATGQAGVVNVIST
jgi:hypothetical protein